MPVQRHGFHNPNTKEVVRTSSLNSEKEKKLNLGWLKFSAQGVA